MKLINSIVSFLFISLFSFASASTFDFSSIGEAGLSVVKNNVAKATQFALNYSVFNKTLTFKDINDFKGGEDNVLRYTLPPGSALKLFCGNQHTRKSGLISLYPPDLTTHTLAPMSRSGIHESLGRVMKNFDVYRSDRTLVHSAPEWFGGSFMFQHPYSSTIVSRDPNFTLNVACVYNLHESSDASESGELATVNGKEKRILYRWIEIKFTDVLPMSYGCGTGNYPLFTNLTPFRNPFTRNGAPYQTSTTCDIVPEPGMIVGIYCADDETFDDKSCFVDDKKMTHYDPEFEHANKPGRLHLFKIPETGLVPDTPFSCKCRDSRGKQTAEVKVVKRTVHVCDFVRVLENLRPRVGAPLQLCRHNLHPGESLRLIAPPDNTYVRQLGSRQLSIIEPSDPKSMTYIQPLGYRQDILAKIQDVIVSKGFNVEKVATKDRLEYQFVYEKDAILIHKTEITGLNYFWTLVNRKIPDRQRIVHRTNNEYVNGLVSIGLVPTDPYTFGCGIRNEFFRNDFVDFETTSENNRVVSKCTIDPRKGPIGFYCPSPYLLEPRGCFNSVIVERIGEDGNVSSQVHPLKSFMKNSRASRSSHFVILEVFKNSPRRRDTESDEDNGREYKSGGPHFDALVCKCVDVKGNTLASIKVLNPNNEIPESRARASG